MALKLSIYDILQGPVLTNKAQEHYEDKGQLLIKVHPQSNKPQIKHALEKLFNVKVDGIRVVVRKGKNKSNRKTRTISTGVTRKHAYITLAAGYSLDLVGQGAVQSSEAPASQAE
jgi:large subunit ribosomal protein L23